MDEFVLVYDYTPLIRLSDLSWPVYFPAIRAENPNTGFPYPCKDYILEGYGYAVINYAAPPEGDVVTEITPTLGEDGKFYRTYSVRDYTPEEKAADLIRRKDDFALRIAGIFANDRRNGIDVEFNQATYASKITSEDISDLLLVKDVATAAQAGDTFRVPLKNGVTSPLNKADTLALIEEILSASNAILQRYLALLGDNYDAVDKESLPEVPETFIVK